MWKRKEHGEEREQMKRDKGEKRQPFSFIWY